jgi:ATP-dependent Lhr-like helicase
MSLQQLHPRLQDFVKNNWRDLTPIQKEAFDPIYNGVSCVIEAPTSGGKTEAVLFPLLTRIASDRSKGFRVLYVAPLKALLNDLALRVVPYAEMCYKEAFKWHGDVGQQDKVNQFIFPSDILLTTPESLEAILLRRGNWPVAFAHLETVVIDEAHYFAMNERGSHLVSLLQRLEAGIKKQIQRVAVTATIGNPDELLYWMTGADSVGRVIRVASTTEKKKEFAIRFFSDEDARLHPYLYSQLPRRKSLVFERSRTGTEDTASRIHAMNNLTGTRNPINVRTHHSSVSKRLREEAETSIKLKNETSLDAIICASTLELGIDIGDLDQVIQVGGLHSSGAFLQRVGRTGRRKEKPQVFIGLCEDPEELVLLTGCVSLGLQGVSEKILFPHKAFHILAHQLICLCLQSGGTSLERAWKVLSPASCFSGITIGEFEELVDYMVEDDFLRRLEDGVLLTSDKTERLFLRANWRRLFAIFDTGPMYNVVDGKKVIGTLDSGFAMVQQLPFVFVLGGKEWNALKIDHERQQILVEKNTTGEAPLWLSMSSQDVPFELAQEIGRLLMNEDKLSFLEDLAQTKFNENRLLYAQLHWNSSKWILDSADDPSIFYLWTFAGDKINRTLAFLTENHFGTTASYDYRSVTIKGDLKHPVPVDQLLDFLGEIETHAATDVEELLVHQIKNKWFSKFSECLPEFLSKKALLEKSFDVPGLIAVGKKIDLARL